MVVISIMSLLFKIKDSILSTRDKIIAVFTPEGEEAIQHTDDDVKNRHLLSIVLEFIVVVLLVCVLVPILFCAYVWLGIFDCFRNTCCVIPEENDSDHPTSPQLLSDNGSDYSSGLDNSSEEIPNKGEIPDFVPGEDRGSGDSFTVLSPCSVEGYRERINMK
ncbi:hypothetical protein IMW63_04085 [Ehrlichia ruminantium]|nr:hypothetical protein IMW63_04085 [Ehrlichia ruminantium]